MKILRMIIIISFVIFGILFIALELTIKLNGKAIAVERLSKAFNRSASIENVKYVFPSGISIRELNIPSALSAKGAKLVIDFPASVSQGRVVFAAISLVEPVLYAEKRPGPRFIWGVYGSSKFQGGFASASNFADSSVSLGADCGKPSEETSQPHPGEDVKGVKIVNDDIFIDIIEPFGKISTLGVTVNQLKVIKGIVHFVDYSLGEDQVTKIDFKDVYLKINDLTVPPKSVRANIDCAGVISSEEYFFDESWFEFNGWVNIKAKDLNVQLKVIDPKGVVSLFSQLSAENNDMLVKGTFSIKGSLSEEKLEGFQASSFGDFMMVAVQKSKMNIDLDFSFKTKIDDFKIEKVNISGDLGMQAADILKESSK